MNMQTDFVAIVPEIFVLSMACLILVADLFVSDRGRVLTYLLSLATLAVGAILTVGVFRGETVVSFNGSFISDPMAVVLKLAIFLLAIGILVYSRRYLMARGLFRGEFLVLALFGVLGMMVMVSAHSLLTLYLGLELMSLCLYTLVALDRDSPVASEAAMKYFVLGAMASGMLLYGVSMLYGVTGSLDISGIAKHIAESGAQDPVLVLGLVFALIGLAFKLGVVPFHMWIPDIYHGAPTAVTLYIGTVPKIATFAVLMRLLAGGLGGLHGEWQDMLIMLAVLSMAIGNIVAIAQANLKRMLAYSTISHMGFLLLGILSGTPYGYSAAMFYTIAYAIMGLGGFGMIILLSRAGFEADRLDDFKGLNERSPWFALMMLILMFSMAGVPPTLGFYAKLAVLNAVVQVNLVWLAVAGVIFSIIGAFYYLRIVKLMYFDKPEDSSPLVAGFDMRAALSVNGLAVLALGVYPAGLMAVCMNAIG